MTFALSMPFEYYDYSWIARHTSAQNTQNMIFIWSTYFQFLKMFQYEKKETKKKNNPNFVLFFSTYHSLGRNCLKKVKKVWVILLLSVFKSNYKD